MSANRRIPYGYTVRNGKTVIEPTEAGYIRKIFEEYINGSTLKDIADSLTAERVPFTIKSFGWDKARVARIIENASYTGDAEYDPIIGTDTYEMAIECKKSRLKAVLGCSHEIEVIGPHIKCERCGHPMMRRISDNSRIRESWTCQNPECKASVRLTDYDLTEKVRVLMNRVIQNSNLLLTSSKYRKQAKHNAERVLLRCVKTGCYSRFRRACADSIVIHDHNTSISVNNENISEYIVSHMLDSTAECCIVHLLSCENAELLGWNVLHVQAKENRQTALVLGINASGFVNEIWFLDPDSCEFGVDWELHSLAMLNHALCYGKAETLREYVTEKCIYRSDYADRMFLGGLRIIQHLRKVQNNLNETDQYTCKIVKSADVLRSQGDLPDIYQGKWCAIEYQGGKLASVIFIQLDQDEKINYILLSCDGSYLRLFEPTPLIKTRPEIL